ncbi:TetR/AcrR family transcriptional regulator [Streptomyces sp. NPDC101150]|uniref:TetR/AcrR family transcriptional regulator n=1 Tax=Streptomyces sp. NPDC101150 TaxID=3366114 RepID=UPI0037F7DE48
MPERKPRKDAVRNRAAVFAAADTLFTQCQSPEDITMADIAAAAGVGKGTLFRAFGDRTGLIRALYEARLEPLRNAVEEGPPPLGPVAPPLQRVPALLDAVLCFKLDNRHLALALEGTGADSPYRTAHYERWHALLRDLLQQIPAPADLDSADFTAHALLAATRADLVEQLAGEKGVPREELRRRLADFTAGVLGARAQRVPADEQSDVAKTRPASTPN